MDIDLNRDVIVIGQKHDLVTNRVLDQSRPAKNVTLMPRSRTCQAVVQLKK